MFDESYGPMLDLSPSAVAIPIVSGPFFLAEAAEEKRLEAPLWSELRITVAVGVDLGVDRLEAAQNC